MRIARVTVPGVVHHLIWRFVDRTWFFKDDHERLMYLHLLGRALMHSDWKCTAYALMSNHLHFAFVAGERALSSWSKRVNSPFARWMNDRHERIGPLMADRAKAHAIRADREANVIAYIHNNPVRAGIAKRARDSRWTSHVYYAGLDQAPEWLHVSLGLERGGFSDGKMFDQWVDRTPGDSGVVPVEEVRKAARRRGGVEVATPIGGDVGVVPLVRRPFGHVAIDPRLVVGVAAEALQISPLDLCSRKRNPAVVAGRFVAVHCAKIVGITGSDIASALALSPAAVSKIAVREPTSLTRKALEVAIARLEIELSLCGHK